MTNKIPVAAAGLMLCLAGSAFAAEKSASEMLDDAGIAATIKAGLLDDKDTHAGKINVESYKGVVQLSGFVQTQAEKDEAAKVAKRVDGVREVHNSIAIQPPSSFGKKLDDSLTTGRVKAALMDSSEVKSMQINVETTNGVTQLAGFVTSESMKERAEKVASKVDGVQRVDNVLIVKPK
jgi:hyperosmotically inducible periplasmic protein